VSRARSRSLRRPGEATLTRSPDSIGLVVFEGVIGAGPLPAPHGSTPTTTRVMTVHRADWRKLDRVRSDRACAARDPGSTGLLPPQLRRDVSGPAWRARFKRRELPRPRRRPRRVMVVPAGGTAAVADAQVLRRVRNGALPLAVPDSRRGLCRGARGPTPSPEGPCR